jgi:hypothetical protein
MVKWKKIKNVEKEEKKKIKSTLSDPNICSIQSKCLNLARKHPQYPDTISFGDTTAMSYDPSTFTP